MWILETRAEILSTHLTIDGARDALRQYNSNDKSGRTASIAELPLSGVLYGVGAIVLFISIGVMLAWRG